MWEILGLRGALLANGDRVTALHTFQIFFFFAKVCFHFCKWNKEHVSLSDEHILRVELAEKYFFLCSNLHSISRVCLSGMTL